MHDPSHDSSSRAAAPAAAGEPALGAWSLRGPYHARCPSRCCRSSRRRHRPLTGRVYCMLCHRISISDSKFRGSKLEVTHPSHDHDGHGTTAAHAAASPANRGRGRGSVPDFSKSGTGVRGRGSGPPSPGNLKSGLGRGLGPPGVTVSHCGGLARRGVGSSHWKGAGIGGLGKMFEILPPDPDSAGIS